jgi:cytidylate kinase
MRLTINGKIGAGKGTVANYLVKKLGLKYYGIGQMRRELAKERGMTIAEFNKLGEKESWTDTLVDDYQKKLVKRNNFIADGRLCWYFIPNSVKVFLTVEPKIGAKRLIEACRKEERFNNIDEAIKGIVDRGKSDIKRYKKIYGIKDVYDIKNYDIVIDTSYLTIKEMNKAVLEAVLAYQKNQCATK